MQGPKNYPSAVQETPTMAADDCTVALCVPVSVVQQRRLDLINELQLRGSAVFCTSIPGICRAPQQACQHPCPKWHGMLCHCRQSRQAVVMCIVTSKTSRVQTNKGTQRRVQSNKQISQAHATAFVDGENGHFHTRATIV